MGRDIGFGNFNTDVNSKARREEVFSFWMERIGLN